MVKLTSNNLGNSKDPESVLIVTMQKDWTFAYRACARLAKSQQHQFIYRHKLFMRNFFLRPNLFSEGWEKVWIFLSECVILFHIVPKEYSGTFTDLLWGRWFCYKMRWQLTIRVSQILSLTRLMTEMKGIYTKQSFYHNYSFKGFTVIRSFVVFH
jgi:hypothetical protein